MSLLSICRAVRGHFSAFEVQLKASVGVCKVKTDILSGAGGKAWRHERGFCVGGSTGDYVSS